MSYPSSKLLEGWFPRREKRTTKKEILPAKNKYESSWCTMPESSSPEMEKTPLKEGIGNADLRIDSMRYPASEKFSSSSLSSKAESTTLSEPHHQIVNVPRRPAKEQRKVPRRPTISFNRRKGNHEREWSEVYRLDPTILWVGVTLIAFLVWKRYRRKRRHRYEAPKLGSISLVTLRVSNLAECKRFYASLGLVVGSESESCVVMYRPGSKAYPAVVLEWTSERRRYSAGSDHSACHLRFEIANIEAEQIRLEDQGYFCLPDPSLEGTDDALSVAQSVNASFQSMVKRSTRFFGDEKDEDEDEDNTEEGESEANLSTMTSILYEDPAGNVVELMKSRRILVRIRYALGLINFPKIAALEISVPSLESSKASLSKLGFQVHSVSDESVQLSKEKFPLVLTKDGSSLSSRQGDSASVTSTPSRMLRIMLVLDPHLTFSITVDDVAVEIDHWTSTGQWFLSHPPARLDLGGALSTAVRATIKDSNGFMVDLVSYPRRLIEHPSVVELRPSSRSMYVLVTGCDGGFGRSLVLQLSGLGFKVIAACYTFEGAEYLKQVATTVQADLRTEKGVQRVVSATRGALKLGGKLYAIVNNAAMCHPGNVEWVQPSAFKEVMDLNFHAPVALIHELCPLLRRTKGRIVNVTSVCGLVSTPSNATYSCSTFALEALSDALRVEHAPFGVAVIAVQPTTLRTQLVAAWPELWKQNYENARPEQKSMHPVEWSDYFVQASEERIDSEAEDDPSETVKTLLNILVMPRPPARIRTGRGSASFYLTSLLPDRLRDWLLLSSTTSPIKFLGTVER